ncbi:MAG TPA: hypothetical protein VL996_03855 [Methylocella sp.]|nr:hypothetical protein [Methylocella sp.]
MFNLRNTIATAVTAATLGLAAAAISTPAAAFEISSGFNQEGWSDIGGTRVPTGLPWAVITAYDNSCHLARLPVYDGYGTVISFSFVRVCG